MTILHIKDTTYGVIDDSTYIRCYYCGKLKDRSVGFYNTCSPECLKLKRELYIKMLIKEGKLIIGCHPALLTPEEYAFVGFP